MAYRLDWRGAQARAQVVEAITSGLTEFGLRHEAESKRELSPGRGVLTGTLRRSIHAAGPDYNFASDDVRAAQSTPERGGGGQAAQKGDKVIVAVGSGMRYARIIEGYYAYMQRGFERVKHELIPILEKHAAAKGLK